MDGFRRVHRFVAALFLLTIPFAAWASFTATDPTKPSPLVYLPLAPMGILTVTGTWLLVRPWIAKWKAKRAA